MKKKLIALKEKFFALSRPVQIGVIVGAIIVMLAARGSGNPTSAPKVASPTPSASTTPSSAQAVSPTSSPLAAPTLPASDAEILGLLANIPTSAPEPTNKFDAAKFGSEGADIDHNGCDTRNDVLRRDLTKVTVEPGTNDCVVVFGELKDPYTGRSIQFHKGDPGIQVDHVVSLSEAWRSGADKFTDTQRLEFANDPLNLLTVDSRKARERQDSGNSGWLPPDTEFHRTFLIRQIQVRAKYGLAMSPDTQTTVRSSLHLVAPAPAPDPAPVPDPSPAADPIPAPAPRPTATRTSSRPTVAPDSGVSYKNCAAVRKAGKAPLHRGEPGYAKHLDRDDDGVACE